ncbi:MAG: bifunctional precorrin-2 dehydrogenase/sirohydrochlorin ferrochelatase [Nitrospirae bacterium]|nr:bifunctional precorrin-2 dehydrogenase/sirohydrochlorin ferrochelatase [Nitrospirota bacterium]
MFQYYPVFLNLERKKAVVVGGGKIAERKTLSLMESGAEITVISPSLTPRLKTAKEKKLIRHISRAYRNNDLKNASLVVAATDSPEVNRQVAKDAPGLVNVVDVPSQCNFIAPSVVKRGDLIIAISSSGVSPALSKTLRKELEKLYGPEFSEYLRFIKKVRTKALSEIREKTGRERFLKWIGSDKMLKMLRDKGVAAVKDEVSGGLKEIVGIELGKKK